MGELVVGHGIKNAGGDLGIRAAVEAFPDDMNIAVELDVLAVLVQPGEVGVHMRRRATVVGQPRQNDLGAVVVGIMQHLLRNKRVLQLAIDIEAADVEVVDDVVRVVAVLAVAAVVVGLCGAFEPEGQRGQQKQQHDREEPCAGGSHERGKSPGGAR